MSRHDNEKLKFITVNVPRPLLTKLDKIKKCEERRTGYRISRSNMIVRIITTFANSYTDIPKESLPDSMADCIPPLPANTFTKPKPDPNVHPSHYAPDRKPVTRAKPEQGIHPGFIGNMHLQ